MDKCRKKTQTEPPIGFPCQASVLSINKHPGTNHLEIQQVLDICTRKAFQTLMLLLFFRHKLHIKLFLYIILRFSSNLALSASFRGFKFIIVLFSVSYQISFLTQQKTKNKKGLFSSKILISGNSKNQNSSFKLTKFNNCLHKLIELKMSFPFCVGL